MRPGGSGERGKVPPGGGGQGRGGAASATTHAQLPSGWQHPFIIRLWVLITVMSSDQSQPGLFHADPESGSLELWQWLPFCVHSPTGERPHLGESAPN